MKTLAIESSCDDTSLAIVNYENGTFEPEKLLLYSQIDFHKKYGGVVPELASRLHEEKIMDLVGEIGLEEIKKVDFISYTCCPGLPGSLLVGTILANTLSIFLNKEKVGVNHIHGHIFSLFIERKLEDIQLPLLVLTVSGGHNQIYLLADKNFQSLKVDDYLEKLAKNYSLDKGSLIEFVGNFKLIKLGWTLDDAAGEAFDKVSKMLGGPYPGGKWIYSKAVESGKWQVERNYRSFIGGLSEDKRKDLENIVFPRIYLKKDEYLFSFSGLKAQVNYKIQELKEKYGENLPQEMVCKICYEFQEAAVESLARKLLKAAENFGISNIAVVGGVSANQRLKEFIQDSASKFGIKNIYFPVKALYSTDNAAMIGVAGLIRQWKVTSYK